MKITSSLKAAPIFLLLLAGCSVTGPLHRRGYNASVVHTPKQLREDPAKEYQPDYIKIEHIDVPTEILCADHDTREWRAGNACRYRKSWSSLNPQPSRAFGQSRYIDFVVTLPKKLQEHAVALS